MSEIKIPEACCANCKHFVETKSNLSNFGRCKNEFASKDKLVSKCFYCDSYLGQGITPHLIIDGQRCEITRLNERIEGLKGNCERFLKTISRFKEALDQKLSARKLRWECPADFHGSENFICNTSIDGKASISIYRETRGLSLSALRDNEPTKYAFVAYFETIDDQVIQIACEDTVFDTQKASQRWIDDLAKSIQRKDME